MALLPVPQHNKTDKNEENNTLVLNIDTTTPSAKRALYKGFHEAKEEAHAEARSLLRIGRPLLWSVIAVSFLHIFDTVAQFKPADVEALTVSPWLHHLTEAALVLAIDATLAYYLAASNVARQAGAKPKTIATWGFIVLTFALNMAYMVRYAPNLEADFRATMLVWLDTFFVFALSAFVPAAIVAIEYASNLIKAARLQLLVEVRTLEEMLGGQKPEKALQSQNGQKPAQQPAPQTQPAQQPEAATGGGRKPYLLSDLQAVLDTIEEPTSRADLQKAIGCGDSTIDKLIAEGIDAGIIERVTRGTYKPVR